MHGPPSTLWSCSESADIPLENFPTCEDCSQPRCPSTWATAVFVVERAHFYTFYNYMIFTFLKTIAVSSRCWSFPRDIGRKRECLGLTFFILGVRSKWGESVFYGLLFASRIPSTYWWLVFRLFGIFCSSISLLFTIVSRSCNVCSSLRFPFSVRKFYFYPFNRPRSQYTTSLRSTVINLRMPSKWLFSVS